MASGREDAKPMANRGRAADRAPAPAAAPRRMGPFRWIAVVLMAVSTLSLLAIAGLLALVYLQLKATDIAALKGDIAGVKTETAAFHADTAKALTGLQKGLADTASEVNSATLQLNDIALGLHKKP